MSGVQKIKVDAVDDGIRLDRWFRRRFPDLTHGRLQKLLRSGQVRVDGGRVKAGVKLSTDQIIRVPPLGQKAHGDDKSSSAIERPKAKYSAPSAADVADLQDRILHIDDHIIAIDKSPGLAVQGGTGTKRHLDGMLDALKMGFEDRPRLVHRLDKDTSGVLLLARDVRSASKLAALFQSRSAQKLYWAVVVGVPDPASGRLNLPLAKVPGRLGERVVVDKVEGKTAITDYRIIDRAGKRAAWLAIEPRTGRTHQIRAHMEALKTPVLGDGKYGGQGAFLEAEGVSRRLHLHARTIRIPHPAGGTLEVTAPLPKHMKSTWAFFGFDENAEDAGFFDDIET